MIYATKSGKHFDKRTWQPVEGAVDQRERLDVTWRRNH